MAVQEDRGRYIAVAVSHIGRSGVGGVAPCTPPNSFEPQKAAAWYSPQRELGESIRKVFQSCNAAALGNVQHQTQINLLPQQARDIDVGGVFMRVPPLRGSMLLGVVVFHGLTPMATHCRRVAAQTMVTKFPQERAILSTSGVVQMCSPLNCGR